MAGTHVRKGDNVLVISGKAKGKKGKVLRTIPETDRVVVEGANMVKKHQRATRKVMQGGVIEKEAPMAASNVMLLCRNCHRPARTGRRVLADGRSVRVCRRCDEVIDK